MTVAKAGRYAGSRVGGRVAASVDVALNGYIEELGVDQDVQLASLRGVCCFQWESERIGEETVRMVEEVGVEADDEVFRSCGGLGVACREQQRKGRGG
jgi:hypothetical protein